jgi:hypothetical protein
MAWAGWGAGPAGAGSVGGPSKLFLAAALVASAVAAGVGVVQREWVVTGVAALATLYFAARLFLGLGRRP